MALAITLSDNSFWDAALVSTIVLYGGVGLLHLVNQGPTGIRRYELKQWLKAATVLWVVCMIAWSLSKLMGWTP